MGFHEIYRSFEYHLTNIRYLLLFLTRTIFHHVRIRTCYLLSMRVVIGRKVPLWAHRLIDYTCSNLNEKLCYIPDENWNKMWVVCINDCLWALLLIWVLRFLKIELKSTLQLKNYPYPHNHPRTRILFFKGFLRYRFKVVSGNRRIAHECLPRLSLGHRRWLNSVQILTIKWRVLKMCMAAFIIFIKSSCDILPYFLRKSLTKATLIMLPWNMSSDLRGRWGGRGKLLTTLEFSGSLSNSIWLSKLYKSNWINI